MQNNDSFNIYDYARKEMIESPKHIYEQQKKNLKKNEKNEIRIYKNNSGCKKSRKTILIFVCICLILFVFIGVKNNYSTIVSSDLNITSEYDLTNQNTNEIKTPNQNEISDNTHILSDETTSVINKYDADSAESYNGYKLGDIVYYNGTVHYVSSNSKQLSGACHGGKAMISGLQPDGLHKFHLVAAEDSCTVYGWVDEVFVSPIEVVE